MIPLLLLHGFGSDRLSWALNESEIAGGRTVITRDLPGHGDNLSQVPEASLSALGEAVFSTIDAPRVHMVGHSLGGAIAIALAHHRPERVASLTLIAPAGLGTGIDGDFLHQFPTLTQAEDAEALLRLLVARPRLINRFMVARVLAHLEKPLARESLAALARLLETLDPPKAPAVPRLVLWGAEDRINPFDPNRVAAFGGEHHVLPDAGHMPHVETPKPVNALIADFLRNKD